MDIGAIFLTLAAITLVALYVGQPYLQRFGRRASREDHEHSALMAEYDRAVNTLQELDFDHTLGKIPAEDYEKQRLELLAKGAGLLRRLDEMKGISGASPENRLETDAASRRADASLPELSDDDLEEMIAARRKKRKEKSAGFCPKCGKPVQISDRFCPSCGKAVN